MALSFLQLGILLVLVVAILAVGVKFLIKIAIKSAPKDIQEIILARPDDPVWMTVIGFVLLIVLFAGVAAIFIWAGKDAIDKGYGFWMIFARFMILLEGYKLFDMVCFDWILLTKLNIFQRLYPETIGCEGYEKFGFNLKSQLIKVVVFALISLIIAFVLTKA